MCTSMRNSLFILFIRIFQFWICTYLFTLDKYTVSLLFKYHVQRILLINHTFHKKLNFSLFRHFALRQLVYFFFFLHIVASLFYIFQLMFPTHTSQGKHKKLLEIFENRFDKRIIYLNEDINYN